VHISRYPRGLGFFHERVSLQRAWFFQRLLLLGVAFFLLRQLLSLELRPFSPASSWFSSGSRIRAVYHRLGHSGRVSTNKQIVGDGSRRVDGRGGLSLAMKYHQKDAQAIGIGADEVSEKKTREEPKGIASSRGG